MNKNALLAALAVGAVASVANAQAVVTFAFNNLDGAYNANTGIFTASASDVPGLRSVGDVTRLTNPSGTADFGAGFVSAPNPANVVVTLSVTGIDLMLGIAMGSGSFVFTDVDGTTLTGNLNGVWIRGDLGQTFFNGDISGATFSNGATFDGDNGNFQTDLGFPAPYEGASTALFLRPGTGGFFDADFRSVATQFQGELVPTPGAMALLGLGGLAMTRRRR